MYRNTEALDQLSIDNAEVAKPAKAEKIEGSPTEMAHEVTHHIRANEAAAVGLHDRANSALQKFLSMIDKGDHEDLGKMLEIEKEIDSLLKEYKSHNAELVKKVDTSLARLDTAQEDMSSKALFDEGEDEKMTDQQVLDEIEDKEAIEKGNYVVAEEITQEEYDQEVAKKKAALTKKSSESANKKKEASSLDKKKDALLAQLDNRLAKAEHKKTPKDVAREEQALMEKTHREKAAFAKRIKKAGFGKDVIARAEKMFDNLYDGWATKQTMAEDMAELLSVGVSEEDLQSAQDFIIENHPTMLPTREMIAAKMTGSQDYDSYTKELSVNQPKKMAKGRSVYKKEESVPQPEKSEKHHTAKTEEPDQKKSPSIVYKSPHNNSVHVDQELKPTMRLTKEERGEYKKWKNLFDAMDTAYLVAKADSFEKSLKSKSSEEAQNFAALEAGNMAAARELIRAGKSLSEAEYWKQRIRPDFRYMPDKTHVDETLDAMSAEADKKAKAREKKWWQFWK